ncbi:hypothetical protein B566_EDAN007126 [Ephemera danica]|nr:hypothetical protein B566_EDAN007126 [Ephemera danica]
MYIVYREVLIRNKLAVGGTDLATPPVFSTTTAAAAGYLRVYVYCSPGRATARTLATCEQGSLASAVYRATAIATSLHQSSSNIRPHHVFSNPFVVLRALQPLPGAPAAATTAAAAPSSGSSPQAPANRMQHYPYLQEMKERLLLAPADSPIPPEPTGMEKEHDQVMDTVIKWQLNPDGFGSHTSPTHAVLYRPAHHGPIGPPRVPPKNAK